MVAEGSKLHLGCGPVVVDGWVNVDGSWSAWIGKHRTIGKVGSKLGLIPKSLTREFYPPGILIHDLRKPLTFARDNSCSMIYTSHVLEHLEYADAQQLLRECHRVLKPGGVVRHVVPSLRDFILEYMGQGRVNFSVGDNLTGADLFSARFLNAYTAPRRGGLLYRVYSAMTNFHIHKWMYDADSLSRHMLNVGFKVAQHRPAFDSDIPDIRSLERSNRIEDGIGIAVEAIK